MESLGFNFFKTFMHYVAVFQWPLVGLFLAFVGYQLKSFHRDQRLQALLMFSYFFLVITSFWILKPIKKSLFIGYYSQSGVDLLGWAMDAAGAEQIAKVMNMFVALAAATIFTLLARTLRRQQLTYVFSVFFGISYLLYILVINSPGDFTVWSFYLFGDLYSTLMVATFFAFLNDSVRSETAKRIYGLIGLGGVAGGFFGSSAVGIYVKGSDPAFGLWLCLGIGAIIGLIAMAAGRIVDRDPPEAKVEKVAEKAEKPAGNPALEGARLVFRSPYLLAIVAIVGLYEMVSTIMDFQFTSSVLHFLGDDKAALSAHFPRVFSFTSLIALVVQLVLTSFVMTRFGVGAALLFLPVAALVGSMGFMAAPVLLFGSLLNTADNGFSYSINQSAKEVLYVPTSREEKYKAKAFIDMFVQRFAKAIAVVLNLGISAAFVGSGGLGGVRWLSLATVAILLLWIWAALYAGKSFRRKEEAAAAA